MILAGYVLVLWGYAGTPFGTRPEEYRVLLPTRDACMSLRQSMLREQIFGYYVIHDNVCQPRYRVEDP